MVALALLQFSTFMAGVAVVFDRVVRPRLPEYHIYVVGLPVPKRSDRTNEWKLAVQTDVDFFNANFIHIDVHALSFDLFYASSTTTIGDDNELSEQRILRHIGSVQDLQQHVTSHPSEAEGAPLLLEQPRQQTGRKRRRNLFQRKGKARKSESKSKGNSTSPLWSIESRSNFTASTTMMTSLNIGDLLRSLYHLLCQWWKNSGSLTVPMTGVAHIRAVTQYDKHDRTKATERSTTAVSATSTSPKVSTRSHHPLALKLPFTVSIICDSLVETWRWQTKITGVECALHNLLPGWTDLEATAATVRDFALHRLPVNATGGVLNHPTLSWEQILETIAWEESLQHP
jgi:hypothetical protein